LTLTYSIAIFPSLAASRGGVPSSADGALVSPGGVVHEFQEDKSKRTIAHRNQLWRRRDALLDALEALHSGDREAETRQVAHATAKGIIAEYWERDANGQPRDVQRVRDAINARDALRPVLLAKDSAARDLAQLKQKARTAWRSACDAVEAQRAEPRAEDPRDVNYEAKPSASLLAVKQEWEPRITAAAAEFDELSAEADALSKEFEAANSRARCLTLVFDDELDEVLVV
jgi:hypothetical protein